MTAFHLSKWYMDCVSEEGEVVIAYAARLRWRAITLHYSGLLRRWPGEDPRTDSSIRACAEPELAGEVLSWSSPAVGFSGRWSLDGPPQPETKIFESPDGEVAWRCLSPHAKAEVTVGERVVRGLGYAEHLVLTVEPWRMPIDELRWGRFVGERSSLVWIDWMGPHAKQLVLLDGRALDRASIDERAVTADGVRLAIDEGGSLRRGAIGATALARIPGIDRFPTRILAVDEHKWCARGTLEDERGSDRGWVVHEIVRWPAAHDAKTDDAARARGNAVGKLLYGLLFAAVLPALLVAWARSTETALPALAWHAPTFGAGLAAAGGLLVLGGWFALWRFGGGLPMNAFPPPRLVTRGVYALVPHPIYVGFAAICFGVSIATGSSSGLWLVSPAVALAAFALVLGYENHDLAQRFGATTPRPWLGLPPAEDAAPTIAQRLSALVLAIAPWLVPSALHPRAIDAGVWIMALGAPFAVAKQRDLRALVLRSLLAVALVFPLHALIPAVTPSLLLVVALLAADAWAARAPAAKWIARAVALLVAGGEILHARGDVPSLAASLACWLAAANAGGIWRVLRGISERVANSWHETRIGPVRFINHGLWAALASGGGIVIIGTCLGPGHFSTLALGASGGLVGAGIWAQTIEGSAALSRPFGFYGGLLGICASAIFAPLLGTPVWLLLGAVSAAAPFIQAAGRVRCLVNGCCHGSETSEAVGIRYHHPRSRVVRLAHLDGVPIHPTQLYSILWNVVSMIVIARLWSLHTALHVIGGVYFILNGTGRFVEEAYRGEPQTPIYARLRLYQWVALAQVIAGALVTALGASPGAPTPRFNAGAVVAGVLFGAIYGFAMGVDFPDSKRRMSRLA